MGGSKFPVPGGRGLFVACLRGPCGAAWWAYFIASATPTDAVRRLMSALKAAASARALPGEADAASAELLGVADALRGPGLPPRARTRRESAERPLRSLPGLRLALRERAERPCSEPTVSRRRSLGHDAPAGPHQTQTDADRRG